MCVCVRVSVFFFARGVLSKTRSTGVAASPTAVGRPAGFSVVWSTGPTVRASMTTHILVPYSY